MTARYVGAGGAAIAAVVLVSATGSGEGLPWRVDVDAPPECPGQAFFVAELQSRIPDARRTPGKGVRIRLSALESGFRGELFRPGFPVRIVVGDRCEDVGRALTLVAAIALDSGAKEEGPASRLPDEAAEVDVSGRGFGAGVSAGIERAGATGWPTRFAVFATVISPSRDFAWRVGLTRTSSPFSGSDVSFTRWTGDVDACLALAGTRTAMYLDACIRLAVGALLARAGDDSATRAWVAPGVLLRPAVRLAGPVSFEVGLGVSAPLVRERFVVARSGVSVGAPPVVIPGGEIGIGLHFP